MWSCQPILHPAYAVASLQAALLMAAATGLKESGAAVLKTPPIVNVEGPGRSCSHACMETSKLMCDVRMQGRHRALLTNLYMRHAERFRSCNDNAYVLQQHS